MNVLLIGRFGFKDTVEAHIKEAFEDLGHNVVPFEVWVKQSLSQAKVFQYATKLQNQLKKISSSFPYFDKRLAEKYERIFDHESFDLVISCHDYLSPLQIDAIRKVSPAPIILWFPDALLNLGKMMFVNAEYDFCFFKDPYLVDVLRNELGVNAFYMPECCNPKYQKPVALTKEDKLKYGCQIATAGNLHSVRAKFFSHLLEYDVKIWGNAPPLWMNVKNIKNMIQYEYVTYEEKCKAFLGAKIVINNLHPTEVRSLNARTFEVAATSAFQLVNYRDSLEDLFVDGKEIISFRTIPELKEKINYYLKHDEERATIGYAGMQRVLKDHTFNKRVTSLIDTVLN